MELRNWDDVKLLTVRVDRLRRWYRPGLLCIGDAAHAMSPVGGVGINLAIQDAVAAANVLAAPLREGTVSPADLAKIQRRREFPTRLTQRVQAAIRQQVGGSLDPPDPDASPGSCGCSNVRPYYPECAPASSVSEYGRST